MADYYGNYQSQGQAAQQQQQQQQPAYVVPQQSQQPYYYQSGGYQSAPPSQATAPLARNPYATDMRAPLKKDHDTSAQHSGIVSDESRRMQSGGNCNDILFAVAFLIQFAAVVGGSLVYYSQHSSDFKNNPHGMVNKHYFTLLIATLICAASSAICWVIIAQKFAKELIKIAIVVSILTQLAVALACFAAGSTLFGIIFLIFAGLIAFWAYTVRNRIEFAAVVLKLSIHALNSMPKTYLVSAMGLLSQCIWMAVWMLGISFLSYYYLSRDEDVPIPIVILFLLSFFWTSQVISGVVCVSSAGCMATWYFLFPQHVPANPVFGSVRRAMTTSFGSICFGSLIVAIVQTVKFILDSLKDNRSGLVRSLVSCLLGCLENVLKYVNMYAFSRIAIYGLSYWQSARETYELFRSKGLDMLINDDLIGMVLSIVVAMSGALSALFACIITYFVMNGVRNWQGWVGLSFILGMAATHSATVIIRSAVATLFVCFAEDPATLHYTKSQEYEQLTQAWRKRFGRLPTRLTNPASPNSYSQRV